MGSRTDARSLIRGAFPGRDAAIDRGLRDHPSFRELCEDYRRCAAALERWQRLNGDDPSARGREYAELLAELANELQDWIDNLEGESARPDRGVLK